MVVSVVQDSWLRFQLLLNADALGLLDAFPALKAHYERVSARPSHALGYGALDPGTYVYECGGAAAGAGAATQLAHPKLVLADK